MTIIERRNFNIIVVPDLSNRITKKCYNNSDEFIIRQFVSLIYPDIINFNREVNQYDIFRLDFINRKQIEAYNSSTIRIDLKKYKKDQTKRNEYLGIFNETSGFKTDTTNFIQIINDLYAKVNNGKVYGSDIYTYFKDLNDVTIDTTNEYIIDSENFEIIHNYFDNIIILLTDGYIETGKENDHRYSLSRNKINEFRKRYISSGNNNSIDSFLNANVNTYGIVPLNNNLLKYTRILVLQLSDRGQNLNNNQNEGLTDIDIMKKIWKNWLTNSGVAPENIELYSSNETIDESSTKDILKKFLKIK